MGKIIGITGGIGAGKSTVSSYLRNKGFEIIDADAIARKLTEKGSPILHKLAQALGSDILLSDGSLDRALTAAIVFHNPEKKALLEKIVTDRVLQEIADKAAACKQVPTGVTFLDVPLLFETDAWKLCDAIWFVTAEEETRIRRVMKREHCTRQEVLDRMAAQLPEEEKQRRADSVIDNTGTPDKLKKILTELLAECGMDPGPNGTKTR